MIMRPIDVLNNLRNHTLWPQSYHLTEAEAKTCMEALEHYIQSQKTTIKIERKENDRF